MPEDKGPEIAPLVKGLREGGIYLENEIVIEALKLAREG